MLRSPVVYNFHFHFRESCFSRSDLLFRLWVCQGLSDWGCFLSSNYEILCERAVRRLTATIALTFLCDFETLELFTLNYFEVQGVHGTLGILTPLFSLTSSAPDGRCGVRYAECRRRLDRTG